jgi:hypothetical protein
VNLLSTFDRIFDIIHMSILLLHLLYIPEKNLTPFRGGDLQIVVSCPAHLHSDSHPHSCSLKFSNNSSSAHAPLLTDQAFCNSVPEHTRHGVVLHQALGL